jgi:L-ribulose-5-phosphate 3-epimerase
MTRRTFAAVAGALPALAADARLPIKKAVYAGMLPRNLSWADRFKLARDVGFEEVECGTQDDATVAEEMKKASEAAGLPIHSVMNQAHWKFPLSSNDSEVVAQSMKGMETSLRNAHLWGANCVLLVPAVMNPQTGYNEAWSRSTANVKKLLPLAEKLKVIIGIEDVWNKFLLSPREMAEYVDQFKSPWVKAYFDVGNIVFYGIPQDWIRTLGAKRIVKLHFKDFKTDRKTSTYSFTKNLIEGDIDWGAVYKALADIGWKGTATVELGGGDEAYLREVARRVDLILTNTATAQQ